MNTPTAALPCPFCGNPPELTHMPIELFNGCIPTRERPAWMIRCASLSCLGPSAHSERSEADAIEKWNRRAVLAVQATADADEAATAIVTAILHGDEKHQAWLREFQPKIAAIIRKAVSPKAAADGPRDIKRLVNRFLGWKLPENFSPDAGISFKKTFNDHFPVPMKHEPTGTNLFDASQTEAMFRYVLELDK